MICLGKIAHATAAGAHVALRRQLNSRKFRRQTGLTLHVYRCPACTLWHISNSMKD